VRAGVGFAVCTAVGLAFAVHWRALGPPTSWTELLRETMPRWYVWGALVPLVARADGRLGAGRGLRARLLVHVPLALGWTAVAVAAEVALGPLLGAEPSRSWFASAAMRYPAELLVYGMLAGALIARDYAAEARRREREASGLAVRAARLEAGLAEARLRALGAQLHPHFLFNALNTVSAYTEREPATARRLMAELGALLRASLDHAARPEVTLAEELAFLDAYLAIERARFAGRLAVAVRADDGALGALVPGFLLQPLVENAIKHGVAPRAAGGRVDVAVRRAGGRLLLRVADDGVGLPAGWVLGDHAGVGLGNVAGRLDGLYPGRHRFRVGPGAEGGVVVEVEVPYRAAAPDASRGAPAA
jgi:signal transduction histidine kinase